MGLGHEVRFCITHFSYWDQPAAKFLKVALSDRKLHGQGPRNETRGDCSAEYAKLNSQYRARSTQPATKLVSYKEPAWLVSDNSYGFFISVSLFIVLAIDSYT